MDPNNNADEHNENNDDRNENEEEQRQTLREWFDCPLSIKYETVEGEKRRLDDRIDGEPPRIKKLSIAGRLLANMRKVDELLHLLNGINDPSCRIRHSTLTLRYDVFDEEISQTLLSILGLLMIRTDELWILLLEAPTDGLCRCIMSGLALPMGVQKLTLLFRECCEGLSQVQAEFLANGLVQSTCLKELCLSSKQARDLITNDSHDTINVTLTNAIANNQSLEELFLDLGQDGNVFAVLVDKLKNCPNNLKRMQLYHGKWSQDQLLALGDYLGHKDCRLKSLTIGNSTFESFPTNFLRVPNTTLESLVVHATNLSSDALHPLCSNLMKLETLHLIRNNIDDFSGLDGILLREKSTLFHLELKCSKVRDDDIVRFVSKLPKMKSLGRLDLFGNSFENQSDATKSCIVENVLTSKSLQLFYFPGIQDHAKANEMRSNLNLNMAAPRGDGNGSLNSPIAMGFWTLILRRCQTAKMEDPIANPKSKQERWDTTGRWRADVIFRLLGEHAYIFDHLKSIRS